MLDEKFTLGRAIGAGSFATVYLARDERLDDDVAVKVLAENHSLVPEIRERFIAEGRALRRVGGANAAVVYDIGESASLQPFLVLEHADRGTLSARVEQLRKSGWTASADDLLSFARALSSCVEDVHRAGLVHRDLSPGNLLLTSRRRPAEHGDTRSGLLRPDEQLLIADLGMCKDLAINSGLTVAGGTSGFRPPEQEKPGVVDVRADVWAMSALLTWLAEGSHVPRELARVLRRGMAVSPQARPADTAAWLRQVESALQVDAGQAAHLLQESGAVHGSSRAAVGSTRDRTQSRSAFRSRRLAALGLATALIAAAFFGWSVVHMWPRSEAGGASVAIDGPSTITVGEETEFKADVRGVSSWVWTMPTGAFVVDAHGVTVRATSVGSGRIVLRARAPDGKDLEVTRTFRVIEK